MFKKTDSETHPGPSLLLGQVGQLSDWPAQVTTQENQGLVEQLRDEHQAELSLCITDELVHDDVVAVVIVVTYDAGEVSGAKS